MSNKDNSSVSKATNKDPTIGKNQNDLIEKMASFLEKELNKYEEEAKLNEGIDLKRDTDLKRDIISREQVVQKLKKSGGECTGLSTLWAYARRLEDIKMQRNESHDQTNNEKDDLAFFKACQRQLLAWDGITEFKDQEKADLYRFIDNTIHFQDPSILVWGNAQTKTQLDLEITLENSKGERPSPLFNKEDFICTKAIFRKRIATIIQPQTMIFLGASKGRNGHMMAAYQNQHDNSIYFFNSNLRHRRDVIYGEKRVTNLDELVDEFWEGSNPSCSGVVDLVLRNVDICVFGFSKDKTFKKYPTKAAFDLTVDEFLQICQGENTAYIVDWPQNEMVKLLCSSLNEKAWSEILEKDGVSQTIKDLFKASAQT